ncbi:hypothetical protein [Candidatus Phytoplasma sp. AldY-WA1]|uniref:hypothetical protein n=1 Tax=Candidatus Phytoplasma sp. AldY-WA1 TaxID=2852100 RepID=UPI00254C8D4A|nr:hypothetical protein [Candidatus Phytoplasma sp. AldY-WA1]
MTCTATVGTIIVSILGGLIIFVVGYTIDCKHGFNDAEDTKETKDTKVRNEDKNENKNEDKNEDKTNNKQR